MFPDVTHVPPLMDSWGLPAPLTETGVLVFIPLMVIAVAVVSVLKFAPVTSANVKAAGVVSGPTVVTDHSLVTPPTETIAVLSTPGLASLVKRTASV